MEPVLQFKNVTKRIGGKVIIDHLSFEVYPGEIFGFLGPNGAGKTTTIRMLVGLMSLTEGEILIHGKSITTQFEKAIAHVGGIVENPEMYKFLTGHQNLVHYARMGKGISRERIDEVVRLVGLTHRIHEKVKTYSLGMRQRLGLAQALLHKPSLLVLDEPTNGLDPAGIREVRDYLKKLAHEEGVAVFVSSHILSEMELMCDRIGIIQQGRLIDVRKVHDMVQGDKELEVIFQVEPEKKAEELLRHYDPSLSFALGEEGLRIRLARERIPDLVAFLVSRGIRIYGIRTAVQSLEEKFLELTGGNQIV
ncbi:ABC transporter ATP-binding protein [Thermicanus aegyptius]|uniref:ABC transporter ATP-binding protein n=1 Tax=Thermicanus aegyptius TaxID=94009 RepID=UPI00048CE5FA|nr:ABC transporter ATP-binding protein [Thermicanus aegyptius]